MKKIALLLIVPLLLGSCLKNDEEKFSDSSADRMEARIAEARKVLSDASNGWVMKYYPEKDRIYGGYTIFVKFTPDEVTASSEVANTGVTATSLYSIKADNGPVLRFDTYNDVLHFFSDAKVGQSGIGTQDGGLEGDQEFTIMEARADYVKLMGKKTNNIMEMTPLAADADWTAEMAKYKSAPEDFSFPGYTLEIGEDKGYVLNIPTDKVYNFTSRKIIMKYPENPEKPETLTTVEIPFIYTLKGLKFYQPVNIRGRVVSEMELMDGYYFVDVAGSDIKFMTPSPVPKDLTVTIDAPTANIGYSSLKINYTASNPDEYYYVVLYDKRDIANRTDAQILKSCISDINKNTKLTPANKLNLYSLKGNKTQTFSRLASKTTYVAIVVGCTPSLDGNSVVSSTSLFKKEFTTIDMPSSASADYKAWLGTWRAVSTSSERSGSPITIEFQIKPNEVDKSVLFVGWSIAHTRTNSRLAPIGVYAASKVTLANDQVVQNLTTGNRLSNRGRSTIDMGGNISYNIVGGTYNVLTLALSADKNSIDATRYAGGLSGGGSFTANYLDCFEQVGPGFTNYFHPSPAPGFSAQDYPVAPWTITKVSANYAPSYSGGGLSIYADESKSVDDTSRVAETSVEALLY